MKRLVWVLVLLSPAALADDSWVLVRDAHRVSMNGDLRILPQAKRFLNKFGPGYLWFRRRDREYLIRDPKTLAKIEETLKVGETGVADEERLGQAEAALDRREAILEKRQEKLERGEDSRPSEGRRRHLEALARAQQELSREQEQIGAAQAELSRAQEKADREMRRRMALLVDASLRDGTARAVP